MFVLDKDLAVFIMECANIIRYQIFTIIFVKFRGYFFKVLLNMVNVILTLSYAAMFIYLFIYLSIYLFIYSFIYLFIYLFFKVDLR